MNFDIDEFENEIIQEPGETLEEELGETLEEEPVETLEEEPGETLEEEPGETLEEEPGETLEEEPGETLEEIVFDYSEDFRILENIGYFQLGFVSILCLFFVLSLVVKYLKSFF